MRVFSLILIMLTLILTGCSREKDFEKKYKTTDAQIKAEMNRLDKQLETELNREPGQQMEPN